MGRSRVEFESGFDWNPESKSGHVDRGQPLWDRRWEQGRPAGASGEVVPSLGAASLEPWGGRHLPVSPGS